MMDLEKAHGSRGRRRSADVGNLHERCLAQAGSKIAQNRRLSPARKSLAILRFRLVRKQKTTIKRHAAAKKQPKSLRTVTLPL